MLKFLFIALLLVKNFGCLDILVNNEELISFKLSSPILIFPNETIEQNIVHIKVFRYGMDQEILKIYNLPKLKNVYLNNTGQRTMTYFENVPMLEVIDFHDNEIELIMSHFFANTTATWIDLHNNQITFIENYSFGNDVSYLDLECNKLNEFSPNWFKNPNQLITLSLAGNYIEHIEKYSFENFTNLHRIFMSLNKIKTIESNAFSARTVFNGIYLSYNNLTELNPDIFQDKKIKISYFDIRHNNISFLSKSLINKLNFVYFPYIDGNPFQCPCYLDYINGTIKSVNIDEVYKDERNEPRCVKSLGPFPNTCIESVDYELINYYRIHRTPVDNNRDKYCSCLKKSNYSHCLDFE